MIRKKSNGPVLAAIILGTVALAYAALDDITTDSDTDFSFEWAALVGCALVLFAVSWRLVRSGRPRI